MSKQVSLYSCFGPPLKRRKTERLASPILPPANSCDIAVGKSVLRKLVNEVAVKDKKQQKNVLDDVMSSEKAKRWKGKFTFWDTPDGKVR